MIALLQFWFRMRLIITPRRPPSEHTNPAIVLFVYESHHWILYVMALHYRRLQLKATNWLWNSCFTTALMSMQYLLTRMALQYGELHPKATRILWSSALLNKGADVRNATFGYYGSPLAMEGFITRLWRYYGNNNHRRRKHQRQNRRLSVLFVMCLSSKGLLFSFHASMFSVRIMSRFWTTCGIEKTPYRLKVCMGV